MYIYYQICKDTALSTTQMKANIILELMFTSIETSLNKQCFNENAMDIYLRIFDELLLTTYKTKCTQFLTLFIAHIDKTNVFFQKWISLLILKAFDTKNVRSQQRGMILNYISSLLSTSNCMQPELFNDTIDILIEYYQKYISNNPKDQCSTLFAQSLSYIVCFRYDIFMGTQVLNLIEKLIFASDLSQMEYSILEELNRIYSSNNEYSGMLTKAMEKNILRIRSYYPFAKAYILPSIRSRFGDLRIFTWHQRTHK
jgi:hypothetical protein